MRIRKAKITDIKQIHKFVNEFAKKEEMLPRALNELYEGIRDFFVYEEDGIIKGVCALRILWEDLAEIRSLAVRKEYQRLGIGKSLIKRCLKDAKDLGIKKVFALTYQPEFFKKLGFIEIDKAKLPHKIWGDCLKCPKFPECDEHAVIIYL
ncbi:MAG: N-acetyltransferase [Nitrospirae bacterium]|nr:N-acetyltransferase [Nitrospirota bacterium]MCL5062298.1 N-acetyltransferase [Nitrospirota bacterium]MDA8214653.1 N-acetyltransferase [Nitrospiraceae bacterium]MDA8338875.1 N-acetyltransferase [Nitrospiraceae bacterium]